ncbi:MAG: hypothetical protein ACFFAN_06800 [Promethearchaeota archaeon]
MQNTIEINKKIHHQIHSKLKNINEQSRNYIQDVIVLINKKIGIDNVLSIILFGSQIPLNNKVENSIISDCDLLIILKDTVSQKCIIEIKKYLIAMEIKHKFREFNSSFCKKILGVIQQSTGMFISHFLTKKKYWDLGSFHKIFSVNKVFSKLLAPKKIVLGSVVDNSNKLYGLDLRENIKKKVEIPSFEMVKSIIMNLIISIFSTVLSPLKSLNSIKYQLEAVKWALRASNFYSFEDSKSLEITINRFIQFERSSGYKRRAKIFYKRFLSLRKNPFQDIGFMLRCPFRILKIHIKGILFKKILKKSRENC